MSTTNQQPETGFTTMLAQLQQVIRSVRFAALWHEKFPEAEDGSIVDLNTALTIAGDALCAQQYEPSRPESDRCGVIHISDKYMRVVDPEINLNYVDPMGHYRVTGAFARLRECLLLPKNYTIHGVFSMQLGRTWAVLVESPDLPEIDNDFSWEGLEWPHIDPVYCQTLDEATGKYTPHIVELRVQAQRTVCISGGMKWLAQASMQQAAKELNITIKEKETEIDGKV